MPQIKNKWPIIITAIIVVAGGVFGLFSVLNRQNPSITNYSECSARGYEIAESFPRQCRTPEGKIFTEDIGNIVEKTDLIIVENLIPGEIISVSPLIVKGKARGSWFFEGSFPIEIIDLNGKKHSPAVAEAEGDWMTEEFVPFTASLYLENIPQGDATLVLRKDNPSGLPEFDDSLFFPVKINLSAEYENIIVYFGKETATSDTDPCDLVYPVTRSVIKTPGIARAAILELLKGPAKEESDRGFFTSLPDGVRLNRIAIIDEEATIDFSDKLEEGVGGSCRVVAIRSQITETLKQFDSVSKVTISINGRIEDILQP